MLEAQHEPGFDLGGYEEDRKRQADRHSQDRDPKKRIRPLCLLEGKRLLQLVQDLALFFSPGEERTLLINLDRKEFAAYEPF